MENLKILGVIWIKLVADDDWPNAKLLQRELFAQGELFDSNAFVWNTPPSMGRYDGSSGKIMLTPRSLYFVEAARPVLDRMADLVKTAVERYKTPGQDAVINSSEFEGLLGIDARRARLLTQVLLEDSWLLRPAGGSINEGQRFDVDDRAILRVGEISSIDEYLDAQEKDWNSAPRGTAIPQPLVEAPEIMEVEPPAPSGIRHGQGVEIPEPLRGMHPVVLSAATTHWVNGHRNEAIDRASVAVCELVKQVSGLSNDDGQRLMGNAFDPDDPRIVVADVSQRLGKDRQKGTQLIAMGAIAGIRNIASHSLTQPSVDDARDQLAVLSFIARRAEEGAHRAADQTDEADDETDGE
jgi:uncharacterized protein (TIGR02391 family)